jgi:putative ABC transport system permease protein
LLLHSFAKAHGLRPGDTLTVTMNGARRAFRIVGLAQSPEFVYTSAPGEFLSDDSHFAVIWMSRTALDATYDMQGAFNQVLLSLSHNAQEGAVLSAVDRLLAPYGGVGAYGLDDHPSDRFVSEEIDGIRAMNTAMPPIFLAVAAFLLYIVISRMVQSERQQIGLIKAFGYSNAEVGAHYLKLILVIAVGGALAGCLGGIVAGRALTSLFLQYYKFPFLVFQLDPASFAIGLTISVLAASAGGLFVLRSVFALTPATAMRPPTPPDYSRTGRVGHSLNRWLDQPSRMVLRNITRQPLRMTGAILGIATGMSLSVGIISIYAGFDHTLDLTFNVVDRSDVTVTFNHALSDKVILELKRMPGVIEVEPVRVVPAILSNGLKSYRGAINGLQPEPRLNRALDQNQHIISMREEGVILATALAKLLDIAPGDKLTIDVREGRQPILQIPVTGLADTLFGSPAYMDMAALNRLLREPNRVSGAYLRIDATHKETIYQQLKNMPNVAGVSRKANTRDAFQELMNTGAGIMRHIMAAIVALITFGIVYNSARIAYAERARDLASLRIIGFTGNEVAFVLLGELAIVTLIALPIGAVLGYYLSFAIAVGFSSDLYQIPAIFTPSSYGVAALAVIAAAMVSGWLVKRDLDRADLLATLAS